MKRISICVHIGVSADFQVDHARLYQAVNANPTLELPERFRRFLANKYADEIAQLESRFGAPANAWLGLPGVAGG